jgi:hypothetical protein
MVASGPGGAFRHELEGGEAKLLRDKLAVQVDFTGRLTICGRWVGCMARRGLPYHRARAEVDSFLRD